MSSAAVIRDMAKGVGLKEEFITVLVDNYKFDTLGKIAYSTGFQPGSKDESPWLAWAKTIVGEEPATDQLAALRQLTHEASAISMHSLRERLTTRDDAEPKQLAKAERVDRYRDQQQRLQGLRLVGHLECSNALIDKTFQQLERDSLSYISPDMCTTRQQEINSDKRTKTVEMTDGYLKVKPTAAALTARVDNEYLLHMALLRRGLAYDQAGLIDMKIHSEWVTLLLDHLTADAIANHRMPTVAHVLAADRTLFVKMAEATRDGIKPTTAGRPLDAAMKAAMENAHVLFHLLPVPSETSTAQSSHQP
eukprot:3189148-Amphidinium_carterae.1